MFPRTAWLLVSPLVLILPTAAQAGLCTIPEAAHPSIQAAVTDPRCNEIVLGEQVYSEQVTVNRLGVVIRGAGAGRTIIASPLRRSLSSLTPSYLPRFTYVIQVAPGASLHLADVTLDGGSSARCGERYVGLRVLNAEAQLDRVVIENVKGRNTDFRCPNVLAAAVTTDPGKTGTLTLKQATVRSFQQAGLLAYGKGASLDVADTVLRGAGKQSAQPQTGIWLASGASGQVARSSLFDLLFTGDPCTGLGTGLRLADATTAAVHEVVVKDADRGAWISKATGKVTLTKNRFVENYQGVFSSDNAAGQVSLSNNAFLGTKRSTAATVSTCFDTSGDAIAVQGESGTQLLGNSAADSARCAIDLLPSSRAVDVQKNQSVRSGRVDLEDRGTSNVFGQNLCKTSTPAGLCESAP